MRNWLKEKFNWLVWGVGFFAVCLFIYQYLFRYGFWLDELSVADNLVQKSFLNLLKPLKKNQIAPVMFLWVEKSLMISADILYKNWVEYFMRIYPFLCGLGVVLLYYKTVFKLTNSKYISLIAYTLLVFNPVFIYYTSEAKQYMCELFFAVLLVYVWLNQSEKGWNVKSTTLFLSVALLSVLNSHTICFVLLPMGLYDGWQLLQKNKWNIKKALKNKDTKFYILRYAGCLIFLLAYYFYFLHNHPSAQYMKNYWTNYFINFENCLKLPADSFAWFFPKINVWIFLLGLLSLLSLKKKQAFILSFFILFAHIMFSYFKMYPVNDRLVFYWMLFLPICIASFFCFCIKITGRFLPQRILFGVVFCLSVIYCFFAVVRQKHFPIYLYDAGYYKKALTLIEPDITQNDVVFTEAFYLPHSFLKKYFDDITKGLYDIEEWNWQLFLRKSISRIGFFTNLNRVWLLTNAVDEKAVADEFKKYQLLALIDFDLVFCKKIEKQVVCFLEKKEANNPNTTNARIDINTTYTEQQAFKVFVDDFEIAEEDWMRRYNQRGFSVQKRGVEESFKIQALIDADINLALRGPWEKVADKLIKHWVDYTSVTINGKDILSKEIAVWHDESYSYIIHAKKGEEYIVHAKWQKHKK